MTDPLSQLRDIHVPETVGLWPLATGWWLLLALFIVLVVAVLWLLKVRRARQLAQQQQAADYRHWAAEQLQTYYCDWQVHQNKRVFLQQAQTLLRRIAIERAGSAAVAALTGRAWCQWLSRQSQQTEFIEGVGQLLGAGAYQPNPDYDVAALYELLAAWIYQSAEPAQPVSALTPAQGEAQNADA